MTDTTATETVSRDEVKEMIVKLLVEELDIQEDQIVDSATLEELDLDSLDMVEIAQVAQRKFGVRIRPTDAEGITDLGGMVSAIHTIINNKNAAAEAPKEEPKEEV